MKLFDKLDKYLVDREYKITIRDNLIHIVNYVEIGDFSSNRVVLKYRGGVTILEGENLVISKMLDDELLIMGKLKSIVYN